MSLIEYNTQELVRRGVVAAEKADDLRRYLVAQENFLAHFATGKRDVSWSAQIGRGAEAAARAGGEATERAVAFCRVVETEMMSDLQVLFAGQADVGRLSAQLGECQAALGQAQSALGAGEAALRQCAELAQEMERLLASLKQRLMG